VPACLRMVLGSFGLDISESELRRQCDCTPYFGTDALMVVDVARQFGFAGTAKHTMTLDELRAILTDGHHPIVFVDLGPIDGIEEVHAVVIVGVAQHEIVVLDPLKGERSLPLQAFSTAWAMRHNLAIIVER
jgi:ABC-type bacteriocin/lantibiotic exporter with double-glycine peptidase domain